MIRRLAPRPHTYVTTPALVIISTLISGCGAEESKTTKTREVVSATSKSPSSAETPRKTDAPPKTESPATQQSVASRQSAPIAREAAAEQPDLETLIRAERLREAAGVLRQQAAEASGKEKTELLIRAAGLFRRCDTFDLSLRCAQEAIAEGANDTRASYLVADCLREQNRTTEAEAMLAEILEKEPDHFEAALSLARIRFRSGETDRSLELFRLYEENAPADHYLRDMARLEKARALVRARRPQEAADLLVTLIEENPTERDYYSELSKTLYRLRQREPAKFVESLYSELSESAFEERAEEGLITSGRVGIGYTQRALIRTRERRYLDAFTAFSVALEADPSDVRIPIYFSGLAKDFARTSDALDALDEVASRSPTLLSGVHEARAEVHLALESWEEAVESFRAALAALEDEGPRGGPPQGQATVQRCSLGLATALVELGAYDSAERTIAQVSMSPELDYVSGRIELARKNVLAASKFFHQALSSGARDRLRSRVLAAGLQSRIPTAEPTAVTDHLTNLPLDPVQIPLCQELLALPKLSDATRTLVEPRKAALEKIRDELRVVRAEIDTTPLAECSALYEQLGDLHGRMGDSHSVELYLLSSDLDPNNTRVVLKLLAGIRTRKEFFLRLRLLRRLLAGDPDNVGAAREVAERYLLLHVRLDEAERLARLAHAGASSAATYDVLARVLLRRDRGDEARELVREGLAKFPSDERLKALAESSP